MLMNKKLSGNRSKDVSYINTAFIFSQRLKVGLAPLVSYVSRGKEELSSLERNLMEKADEVEQVQHKIDGSSRLLKWVSIQYVGDV